MNALLLQTWRQLLESSVLSSSATRTQDLALFLSYLLHLRGESASAFIETNGLDVTTFSTPTITTSLTADQERGIRAVMQLQPTWQTFCCVDQLGASPESKTIEPADETTLQKAKALLSSASVLQSQQTILNALTKSSKSDGSRSTCRTSRRNSRVMEKMSSKGPSDSAIEDMEKIEASLDRLNSSGSWQSLLDETHSVHEQRFVLTTEKELLIEAGRIGASLERSNEHRLEEQRAVDPRPARLEALFNSDVDPWMNRLLKSNSEPVHQAQRCVFRTTDAFSASRNQLPNANTFNTMPSAKSAPRGAAAAASTPDGALFGSAGGIAPAHAQARRRSSIQSAELPVASK